MKILLLNAVLLVLIIETKPRKSFLSFLTILTYFIINDLIGKNDRDYKVFRVQSVFISPLKTLV